MKLNSDQERAANILEGNLLIVASAGTGKTTTIVERYVNLIEKKGLFPEEILMTTFTNKAAKDMVEKIKNRTDKISPYVGTMHALFLKILREHPIPAFKGKNYTLITERSEQKKIIREILEKEGLSKKADSVEYFYQWIGKFKNRGILAEDLAWEGGIDEAKESGLIPELLDDQIIYVNPKWRRQVNKIYKKYQEYLHENSLLDFDEILILTYRLFQENPQILKNYKEQFKAIMVDEAQDLNVIQVRILDQLKSNNLCLIGDDCQNIYEWRGSSNDLIFNFEESENTIYLKDNYRSTQNIITAVNKVISSMKNKIDKKLVPTRGELETITINGYRKADEEIEATVQEISQRIEMGAKPEDIAVLFRTNMIGKAVEREFRRRAIPCHLSKTIDFFEREEIKDIISFLKLSVNNSSRPDFERILSLIKGFGKVKVSKLVSFAWDEEITYVDALKRIQEFNWGEEINYRGDLILRSLLSENPLRAFLDEFDYVECLENKYSQDLNKLDDKLENVKVFSDLYERSIDSSNTVLEFLDSLMDIEKREKTKDKVTLSTIHGAKGLEWKTVYLVSCNEGILPYYKDDITKGKRDSELRLFYVAISRAKDNLIISYSRFQGYKYFPPSEFLDIIYDFEFKPAEDY